MSAPQRPLRRGQPVVALVLLLSLWVGARSMVWAASGPDRAEPGTAASLALTGGIGPASSARTQPDASPAGALPHAPQTAPPADAGPAAALVPVAPPVWPDAQAGLEARPLAPAVPDPALAGGVTPVPVSPPPTAAVPPRIAGGHQLLWMAALSQLPMPELQGSSQPLRSLAAPTVSAAARKTRWSADAWLMLRRGGNGFNLPGAGLPGASLPVGAYGASQAGAVIRYRLAPSSPLRPALYLRATSALHAPRGEELAGGLTLRPVPRLPVAAMIEARATRTMTGTVVRPAAALVSELPPVALPGGLRGEAYVQAGYVGGRDATLFVDGQGRIERRLISTGRWELRAGAGTWGGAQRGAKRLDVGPTATLAVPLGPVGGRLSADWRFRVLGNAAPSSGPAITLSAGF
ncbi:MAG: hypothetical protein ABL926_01015 [Novosphingobium sp.]|uniref:hypothetical protein n=1 Tax=Novosphingobium sp. TaxID=1874826 RepID=UPI0032B72647